MRRGKAFGVVLLAVLLSAQGWPPRNGSSLPATCADGEGFFLTSTTGTQFYECIGLNTWTHIIPGAPGVGSAWGGITGTLSDQTDLQTALDGKEPAGVAFSDLSGSATAAQLPNPGAGSKGGVSSLTCNGTDKLSAIGTDGVPVCSADQTGAGGGPTVVRVTADVTDTSITTWQDVTGLTKAVVSGTTYAFACYLTYTTAATTTALQLSLNGPTVTALDYGVEMSTTATARHNSAQTAYDTAVNPATGGGATRLPAVIHGTIIPSANGTLAVRMRTEIDTSAATVKRGSWCEFHTL